MSVFFLAIFILPFIALLVVGLVVAIFQRSSGPSSSVAAPRPAASGFGRLAIGLGIACGVVLMVLLLLGLVAFPQAHTSTSSVAIESVPSPVPSASYQWNQSQKKDDLTLARSPHTSMKTLKAFMAAGIENSLSNVGDAEGKCWVEAEGKVPPELLTAVRSAVHADSSGSQKDRGENDSVVTIRWTDGPGELSAPWWPRPMRFGTLAADVKGPHGEAAVSTRLEEKPWIDGQPRADYVVVTSGPPTAPTRDDAVRLLNDAKTQTLTQTVAQRAAALTGRWPASMDDVRQQVLSSYPHVEQAFDDEVVVEIDKPSIGPVWQAAGLLHVPAAKVDSLARSAYVVSQARRASWASLLGGSAGMMLVLLLVYAGLNLITRGYFRTHLRTATAIVLAVALAIIFLRMA